MKAIAWGIAALGLSACNAVPDVGATASYASLSLDGNFGVSSGPSVVTSDTDALGFADNEGAPAPRFDASWLGLDAWASWYDVRFAGTGAAEGQLDLGGVVIAAGEPVVSEFDIVLGTGGVTYDFIPGDLVDFGVGLGIGFVNFDAEITSLSSSLGIATDESFGLPLLAARGAVKTGDLELSVVGVGLAMEVDGDEVAVLDADAMLRWRFLDVGPTHGGLVIGYRYTDVDAEYESGGSRFDTDMTLSGPYAGVSIQF